MLRKRRYAADEPFIQIRSSPSYAPAGRRIPRHWAVEWHQLIHVSEGLLVVETDQGSWLAPPSWAIWAPAGAPHTLRLVATSSYLTLFIRPGAVRDLPASPRALGVSHLLRALVLRTVDVGMLDSRDPVEAAMAALIFAELGRSGPPPFALPQPTGDATRRAASLLADDAAGEANLAAVARAVGLGARTLERRFRAETGLTPARWRQQRKMLASLELIAAGEMVKTAADAAGFATASAYVATFRKLFGTTPARYFARS
jgi:AraC-like DNA-binding protein